MAQGTRNAEVGAMLVVISDLLEVKGEQSFRINAYRKAARTIEELREDIEDLSSEGRLREIPGIGEALEQKISEYLETGRLGYLERLQAEFPSELLTLLDVPGLGPKRARLIYDTLRIGSLPELEQAA